MHRLGYTRYVAQGGDVGAAITDAMGRQAPEGLVGIHMNLLVTGAGRRRPAADTDEEHAAVAALATFRATGFGYFLEQATRPQTIGYALLDSPVALAAWMLDHDTDSYYKIAGAFVDGKPSGNLTRDHILDNITLYWLTGTGASAARSYWESGRAQLLRPARLLRRSRSRSASPRSPTRSSRPAQLGRAGVPQPHLLQRGRRGRPLRRLGGAAALLEESEPRSGRFAEACVQHATSPRMRGAAACRGHLPGFDGATGWLNSEPLTPEGLRGKVVLVDFWTYTCINWLRTLAYVRAWAEKYQDQGLVVVGVHTPEFPFEHDVDNVRWPRRR